MYLFVLGVENDLLSQIFQMFHKHIQLNSLSIHTVCSKAIFLRTFIQHVSYTVKKMGFVFNINYCIASLLPLKEDTAFSNPIAQCTIYLLKETG